MEKEEIYKHINDIEVRTSLMRGIKSYAIRNNVLDDNQKKSVEAYFPEYAVVFRDEFTDPRTLFADPSKPVIIEIGFGMGTSTEIIARERKDYNYLCLEVYLQGFVRLLKAVGEEKMPNIKLMRFNAVDVLEHMIPDNSIDGFHIFFPDPWPKKKHHKRRLIQKDFVNLLAKKLKKGGYLYLVTDWEEYAEWMIEILSGEELLFNPYECYAPPREWRPRTKFEQKGLDKDYKINEIWFVKR